MIAFSAGHRTISGYYTWNQKLPFNFNKLPSKMFIVHWKNKHIKFNGQDLLTVMVKSTQLEIIISNCNRLVTGQ